MVVERQDKGKIVVVKGISQYNVLTYTAEQLTNSFKSYGYRVTLLDGKVYGDNIIEILLSEMKDNGKFIFVINPILYSTLVGGRIPLFDYLGYPVFTYMVDHPFYHTQRLQSVNNEKICLSCVDFNHITYVKRYHPNIKKSVFLPHFGFMAKEQIPYEERTIDLYFPGSYLNPQKRLAAIEQLPGVLSRVAKIVASEMISDEKLTLDEALIKYLDSISFEYEDEDIPELMSALACVDQYVRDYHRHNIITEILKHHIPLTVSGTGWSELQKEYPDYLTVLSEEGMDIEENILVIANSKIVLNVLPNFKNGTHERVFTALMNGCICLTNDNQFFKRNFEENKEIVFYDIDHLEGLPGIIHNILNDPQKAMSIAKEGRKKIKEEYGFDSIAKQILLFMGYEE